MNRADSTVKSSREGDLEIARYVWFSHKKNCTEHCAKVNGLDSSTVNNVCYYGSRLLKEYLSMKERLRK